MTYHPERAWPSKEGRARFFSWLAMLTLATGSVVEAKDETTERIAQASVKAPKLERFELAKAPPIPSLAEGGFVAKPGYEDNFAPGWVPGEHDWRVATWRQNGTKMAKDRVKVVEPGYLTQTVLAGKPFRGGSIQSTREFGYGRWIARVKPSSVPGVLNSIFTKDWDDLTTKEPDNDGRKAEVDIEFVTKTFGEGEGEVHLAVHLLKHTPLWHVDIPLDFNPSDNFHEWGFDILPDRCVWHVDGKVLYTWEYTEQHRVDPGYEFFFNSWTRGKWIEGPPKQDAVYEIDWVRFYPLVQSGE